MKVVKKVQCYFNGKLTNCEEYDEKGNIINRKESTGYEEYYEYDNNGNVIHFKDTDGYEEVYEYLD